MTAAIDLFPQEQFTKLPHVQGGACVFSNITFQGEAIKLWVPEEDRDVVLGYDVEQDGSRFRRTQTERSYTGQLAITGLNGTRFCEMPNLNLAFPKVVTFPGGRSVVASTRCRRLRDGSHELNGNVYGADGSVEARFCLGDAIKHLQIDASGRIWAGYSDEGVFGNYGWGPLFGDATPIGAAGLVCFDRNGSCMWEYKEPQGFDHLIDCYALNCADEAVWVCCYIDFPIIRIDSEFRVTAWHSDLSGPREMAVDGDRLLVYGGYMDNANDCWLVKLGDSAAERILPVQLRLPNGVGLDNAAVVGRGRFLHVLIDDFWYRFAVPPI